MILAVNIYITTIEDDLHELLQKFEYKIESYGGLHDDDSDDFSDSDWIVIVYYGSYDIFILEVFSDTLNLFCREMTIISKSHLIKT